MADWQKVAAARLVTIRTMKRTHALAAKELERKARRAIEGAVHATGLASLSHPTTKAMIDMAVTNFLRDIDPTKVFQDTP